MALLAGGADINAKAALGGTPLHLAAWFGHMETVLTLLAAGADVSAPTSGGTTPLNASGREDHERDSGSYFA